MRNKNWKLIVKNGRLILALEEWDGHFFDDWQQLKKSIKFTFRNLINYKIRLSIRKQ